MVKLKGGRLEYESPGTHSSLKSKLKELGSVIRRRKIKNVHLIYIRKLFFSEHVRSNTL